MNVLNPLSCGLIVIGIGISSFAANAQAQIPAKSNPYKIVNTAQTMGEGGIDYVYADNDNRRLYVPRGNQVLVFDLDTLKSAGSITNARAHGVAVIPGPSTVFAAAALS